MRNLIRFLDDNYVKCFLCNVDLALIIVSG